ncbi:MAG: flagellar hook-basal body complex protein FliE [Sporichthyaceae bacterium]
MTIAPIGFTAINPIIAPSAAGIAPSGTQAAGESFASMLGAGLESVAAAQHKADGLAVQAATGELTDVHDYTIAATQAQLATELTVAIRNKAVEAFNDIMRMPL